MNDLRTTRKLAAVPDQKHPTITRTPPRSRPATGEVISKALPKTRPVDEDEDTKKLRRRRSANDLKPVSSADADIDLDESEQESEAEGGQDVASVRAVSEQDDETETEAEVVEVSAESTTEQGPTKRPARRRDDPEDSEESFPWHHQFDDDEPEELQATSPLLSRAFRATTG